MSTLFVNNLNTASGSTITVPTGKQVIVTDEGGLRVPGSVIQVVNAEKLDTASTNSNMPSWVDSGLSCPFTQKLVIQKL